MPACSFCKKNYEAPRGLTVFTFDGRSLFFCSSKCRRNADLGRDSKKVNWVKREKKAKDKVSDVEVKKNVEKKEEKKTVEVKEKVDEKKEVKKETKVEEKVAQKEESK